MADDQTQSPPPDRRKFRLTAGSLQILDSFLGAPAWAKDPKTIYMAGKLLGNLEVMLQKTGQPPRPVFESDTPSDVARKMADEFNEATKEWAESEFTWDIAEDELAVLSMASHHHIEAGNIPPSKHLCCIIEQFGLMEE